MHFLFFFLEDSCTLEVCLELLGLSLLQNPGAVRALTRKQTLHKARINADTQWSYRVISLSMSRVPPLGSTKRPEIGLLQVGGALERAAAPSGSRTRSWCEARPTFRPSSNAPECPTTTRRLHSPLGPSSSTYREPRSLAIRTCHLLQERRCVSPSALPDPRCGNRPATTSPQTKIFGRERFAACATGCCQFLELLRGARFRT